MISIEISLLLQLCCHHTNLFITFTTQSLQTNDLVRHDYFYALNTTNPRTNFMITTRINTSKVKRLHGPFTDRALPGYFRTEDDLLVTILKTPEVFEIHDLTFQQKLSDLQKKYYLEQFKGWCMPEPPVGYLKPARHFLL